MDKEALKSNVERFRDSILNKYGDKLDDFHVYVGSQPDVIHLGSIRIKQDFRKQGIGSDILQRLTEFADDVGATIVLSPEPQRGFKKKLDLLYRRFGFVPNRGRAKNYQLSSPFSSTMYRSPKSQIKEEISLITEKTLYHGTTIEHSKDIEKIGLVPDIGDFVNAVYGEYYDEYDDNDGLDPLVFAADKEGISRCLVAMVHHIGHQIGKDLHSVTDEEIKKYGALVIIRDGDESMEQKPTEIKPRDSIFAKDYPVSVEPGDYYSGSSVGVDDVLTGNTMIKVLKRYGIWPRTWGPDADKNMFYYVAKWHIQKHPEKTPRETVEYLRKLPMKDIRSFFNQHIRAHLK